MTSLRPFRAFGLLFAVLAFSLAPQRVSAAPAPSDPTVHNATEAVMYASGLLDGAAQIAQAAASPLPHVPYRDMAAYWVTLAGLFRAIGATAGALYADGVAWAFANASVLEGEPQWGA